MPTRKLYLQDPDRSFLATPRTLINPGANIFEISFSPNTEIENWADWMQWDLGAIENNLATSDRKNSSASTYSICDASTASQTSVYSPKNEFLYTDAPFDFDETVEASQFSYADAPFDFDETVEACQLPTTTQMLQSSRRPTQRYSTLSAAERQLLEAIAMPYRTLPQTIIEPESPTTLSYTMSRSPSLDAKPTPCKTKKKKPSVEDDKAPNVLSQSRKRGHNAIEKRYRTNLNDKISCLRQGIPPSWRSSSIDTKFGNEVEATSNEIEKNKTYQKNGKAAILTRALEYIQYLEGTTQKLGGDVDGLMTRVEAFEKLAMSGSVVISARELPQRLALAPRQTLLSIQADFKQIKKRSKSASSTVRKPSNMKAGR